MHCVQQATRLCAPRVREKMHKCYLCSSRAHVHEVTCPQVFPNLLELQWGNGCSLHLQGCKTPDYIREVNEKELQKYTPRMMWP